MRRVWSIIGAVLAVSWAASLGAQQPTGTIRGRVIGLFSMTSLGFRTFSGLSVGLAGSAIGIHRSLALSAAAAFVVMGFLLAVTGRTTSGFR